MNDSPDQQVVITGAGLVTPLGLSREATWEAVRAGRCGMGPLSAMEQALPPGSTGGQAPDLPADWCPELPREARYLRRAMTEALAHAGIEDNKRFQLPDAGSEVPRRTGSNLEESGSSGYLTTGVKRHTGHHNASNRAYSPDRSGVMLGTTLHGMRTAGRFLRSGDPGLLGEFLAGRTLGNAARPWRFSGFAATTCSACSSSLGAIALGVSLLRSGQLDLVVAGGYDTISEYVYAGFNSLRLVAPGPVRPFAKDRLGMKLAEGYGIVVLERARDARSRGAAPLATILGYGESSDAHHLTQPHPEGQGAARAMSAALTAAGLTPGDIGLVAAHATGTPDNDAGEYAALLRVFGQDLPRVPVVAFKSHLGHTLGAAGAVELILSALSLRDQIVPACVNVSPGDVEFPGLNVSTGNAKQSQLRATLNTSLGFGGANTAMVLGKGDCASTVPPSPGTPGEGRGESLPLEPQKAPSPYPSPGVPGEGARLPCAILVGSAPRTDSYTHEIPVRGADPTGSTTRDPERRFGNARRDVFISGVGVVLPGMIGNGAFARAMAAAEPERIVADSGPIPEDQYLHLLNARRVRRMSDYVKLSLAATMIACGDAKIGDIPAFASECAAVLGSTHGSSNYSEAYYGQIVREGIPGANPLLFAEGVPNAAAAHLSLMLSLKGPCQTVIGTRTAGLDALHLAAMRIAAGEWDRAIVSAGEEFCPVVNAAYGARGLYRDPARPVSSNPTGFVVGCGGVTLVLESGQSLQQRGVNPRGKLLRSTGPMPVPRSAWRLAPAMRTFIGDNTPILGSANGTWLDRFERELFDSRPDVSTLYGRLPEIYSVTPLAGVAGHLLLRRGAGVAVFCSDYTRLVSGAVVVLEGERGA